MNAPHRYLIYSGSLKRLAEMLSRVHAAVFSCRCLTAKNVPGLPANFRPFGVLLQHCTNAYEYMQTWLAGHAYQCLNEELPSLLEKKAEYPCNQTVRVELGRAFYLFFWHPTLGTKQLPLMGHSLESVPRRKKKESKPFQMQLILHV